MESKKIIKKFLKVVLAGSLLGAVAFQTANIYAMEEQNYEQKAKLTQFLQQKLHTGKLRPQLYRTIKKSIEPTNLFAKIHSNDIEYLGITLEEQQILGELYQKYADLIPANHLKEIAQTAAALPVADLLIKGGAAAITAITAGKVVEHNLKNSSSSISSSSSASRPQSKVTTAPSSSNRERLGPPAPASTWNKTTSAPSAQTVSKKEQKRIERTGEQSSSGKDLVKVNDGYLEKQGINAHREKKELIGGSVARGDIYLNKKTGELEVYRKGGTGSGIGTGKKSNKK